MPFLNRSRSIVLALGLTVAGLNGSVLFGDEKDTLNDLQTLLSARRNYKVPDGGLDQLVPFLKSVKLNRPRTDDEFLQMQRAIRTAADRILQLDSDAHSAVHQNALQDSLYAGARLLGTQKADEQQQEIARLQAYLAKSSLTATDLTIAKAAAQELERAGNKELATAAYKSFADRFEKSTDAQVRDATKMLAGAARRLTIVGQPFELTGKKIDGSDFDLKSLEGKVVLVEFWATWCQKCKAELPHVKRNYEKFHAQGFEVVAVSVDENHDDLTKFLVDEQVPWPIVHDREAQGKHPDVTKYGIYTLPATFLIGRDGNVIATRISGEALDAALEKAF